MPDLPEEAVQAAMQHVTSQPLLWQYVDEQDVRAILEAAAPILATAMEKKPMPETPRLRPGNRNPQNLYLLNDDGSETFVAVAMTPEYADMIVQRVNATTTAEADIRADERRKTIEEMTARLRRAAAGRREYDRGEPPTWAHEALQAEAATLETAIRVLEDPMAMLGLIPSWMWTAEEEARFDEPSPCEVAIDEALTDERRKAAEQITAYEDLLGSIWLYIGWRYVTKQLTTEQKEMFAAAVEASERRMNGDGEPFDVDRWWRDGAATRQAGDARDPR